MKSSLQVAAISGLLATALLGALGQEPLRPEVVPSRNLRATANGGRVLPKKTNNGNKGGNRGDDKGGNKGRSNGGNGGGMVDGAIVTGQSDTTVVDIETPAKGAKGGGPKEGGREPKDGEPKDGGPKDGEPKGGEPKGGGPKGGGPRSGPPAKKQDKTKLWNGGKSVDQFGGSPPSDFKDPSGRKSEKDEQAEMEAEGAAAEAAAEAEQMAYDAEIEEEDEEEVEGEEEELILEGLEESVDDADAGKGGGKGDGMKDQGKDKPKKERPADALKQEADPSEPADASAPGPGEKRKEAKPKHQVEEITALADAPEEEPEDLRKKPDRAPPEGEEATVNDEEFEEQQAELLQDFRKEAEKEEGEEVSNGANGRKKGKAETPKAEEPKDKAEAPKAEAEAPEAEAPKV